MISYKHSQAARRNVKKAWKTLVKPKISKICLNCRKHFATFPSEDKRGRKFCLWKCRREFMVGENASGYGGGKWMLGENNPRWSGGMKNERIGRSYRAKIAHWRRIVFARDKYICQRCFKETRKKNFLRAHHKILWSKSVKHRFLTTNGITLCNDCHKWIHKPVNNPNRFII